MKTWPVYYKDLLTLSNRESNIGICTLWTPKDIVCSKISKQHFCISGQLYSKRGINYILRNIYAKPTINTVIICGNDKSGSGKAFVDFMKNGSDKEGVIQSSIDKKHLELFREKVKLVDLREVTIPETIDRKAELLSKKIKAWTKPKYFPEVKERVADRFPSEKTTFNLRSEYIWQAWIQILRLIMKFGSKKGMIKIGEVRELTNIVTVIEKEDPYKPELEELFGFDNRELITYYKAFFNADKGTETYNYGERLRAYPRGIPVDEYNAVTNTKLAAAFKKYAEKQPKGGLDQLEEMFNKFERYHEDRGLVMALWNPWVDNVKEGWMAAKSKKAGNVPCMVLLQFTYRSKKLHLTAYFRSNDMFDAWPRNAFALRKLQFDFAKRVGKHVGCLTTISNCAQIYENNYSKALRLVDKYKDIMFCRPDPRSTLIIETIGKEIVVRQMEPAGNAQLDEYRISGLLPKAAMQLIDRLVANNVFGTLEHAADIGIELSKAELCIKKGGKYIQDRAWEEMIDL